MLDDEEIDALEAGTWSIHCRRIQLKRYGPRPPEQLSGPGRIFQAPNGALRFTLYATQQWNGVEVTPSGSIGEFISEEDYFQLSAQDAEGREWSCSRMAPDDPLVVLGLPRSMPPGSVWEGFIPALTGSSAQTNAHKMDRVEAFAFVPISYPANAGTRSRLESPLTLRMVSALDCATFTALGAECELHSARRRTRLMAKVTRPVEGYWLAVVSAGLEFVLATPVEWAVTAITREAEETATITSAALMAARAPQRLYPLEPPAPRGIVPTQDTTWRLLDQYATFIAAAGDVQPHQFAAEMRSVLRSSIASLEDHALITAVAVEAVVNAVVNERAIPIPEELRHWCRDTADGSPPDFRERIRGLLGLLLGVSASDRLHYLAQLGAVDQRHVDMWKDLRNAVTHGGDISDNPIDAVRNVDAATVLIYTIIFFAIGYRGLYRDLGASPWRVRRYEPGPGGPGRDPANKAGRESGP